MSKKVAASDTPPAEEVLVREYKEGTDRAAVEELEGQCDLGQCEKTTMVTDVMGDPLCRVRHFLCHAMLVAEYGKEKKMVGVVRGCVKDVTRGSSSYVKLAYVLGLRVSPTHRNLGIGTKLVHALEDWFKRQGAEYAYMATDSANAPSINLFTRKCSYLKFRTPTVLVQPVHAHSKPTGSNITIVQVNPRLAASIYRRTFAGSEFFPEDIDNVLASSHSLGTFMAVPRDYSAEPGGSLPPSFAMLSVWSTKEVFRLQVKGVSRLVRTCCRGTRLVDSCMPWLRVPSFPDVFRNFWVYFMYGLHMEGQSGPRLMTALCSFVHNMGRCDEGCAAVVAELGRQDPVAATIPHWRRLSLAEDLWCLKRLTRDNIVRDELDQSDWIKSRSSVIFVDPRDI